MSQKGTLAIVVVAAIVIAGGLFYIVDLRSTLADAQAQSAAARSEVTALQASLGEAKNNVAAGEESRKQIQAELEQTKTELAAAAETSQEVEALKQRVAELEATAAYGRKVQVWWRDLFDYTKPFDGVEETGGN